MSFPPRVHIPNPISVVFFTSIKDSPLATVSDSVSVDKLMNGTMVHIYIVGPIYG